MFRSRNSCKNFPIVSFILNSSTKLIGYLYWLWIEFRSSIQKLQTFKSEDWWRSNWTAFSDPSVLVIMIQKITKQFYYTCLDNYHVETTSFFKYWNQVLRINLFSKGSPWSCGCTITIPKENNSFHRSHDREKLFKVGPKSSECWVFFCTSGIHLYNRCFVSVS